MYYFNVKNNCKNAILTAFWMFLLFVFKSVSSEVILLILLLVLGYVCVFYCICLALAVPNIQYRERFVIGVIMI